MPPTGGVGGTKKVTMSVNEDFFTHDNFCHFWMRNHPEQALLLPLQTRTSIYSTRTRTS